MEGSVCNWFKNKHSTRILLTASYSRTCGNASCGRLIPLCFTLETWAFLSHHVTFRGKQALRSCWSCRNSKYTPRHTADDTSRVFERVVPRPEALYVCRWATARNFPPRPVGCRYRSRFTRFMVRGKNLNKNVYHKNSLNWSRAS